MSSDHAGDGRQRAFAGDRAERGGDLGRRDLRRPLRDGDPVVVSVVVVGTVVRWLAERNERLVSRLAAEARVDSLTGLLNRRGFQERMAVEVARAARAGRPLGVVEVDIDHFKRVNDEHGHDAGDRVLGWLGALLADHARDADVVARVGGGVAAASVPFQAETLLDGPDRALYAAKRAGRNRTAVEGVTTGAIAAPAAAA